MTAAQRVNLTLRVLVEVGVVAGLASWGVRTGDGTTMKALLGVGAPALGFGCWGAVDFHQLGGLAEPARLVEELLLSGLAALAWYAAGSHGFGIALGALSGVYHGLVYLTGERLLKRPRGFKRRERRAERRRAEPTRSAPLHLERASRP